MSLELAGERQIAINDRGKLYRFTLEPITREMWQRYFDGIVSTSEPKGREQLNTFDANSALLALVHDALRGASGYQLGDGVITPAPDITVVEGWKTKLRFSHRIAIGRALINCSAIESSDDGEEATLGSERVELEAMWNADVNGVMFMYRPLVHNFATPQFEHEQRYMRAQSRSKVVGGSRTGKTIWMGAQRALIEIYDDLIESVEGYTLNGEPLAGRAQIAQAMDAYHKVVATQELFRPPALDPEPEAEAVA